MRGVSGAGGVCVKMTAPPMEAPAFFVPPPSTLQCDHTYGVFNSHLQTISFIS